MTHKDLDKIQQKIKDKNPEDTYNIFPEPISGQEAFNLLIDHFLGPDWYVVNPISTEQVNMEALYEIIGKYKEKWYKRIARKLNKIMDIIFEWGE